MTIRLTPAGTTDDFASRTLRSRAGKAPQLPTSHLLRVWSGPAEVGLVVLDIHEGSECVILYELFVLSELRDDGVGTRVLSAVEEHVRASGRSCLEVWPRSLDQGSRSDLQLARWYERHGYVATGPGSERLRKVL